MNKLPKELGHYLKDNEGRFWTVCAEEVNHTDFESVDLKNVWLWLDYGEDGLHIKCNSLADLPDIFPQRSITNLENDILDELRAGYDSYCQESACDIQREDMAND